MILKSKHMKMKLYNPERLEGYFWQFFHIDRDAVLSVIVLCLSFFQDLTSAERARKAVEAERDELLEEINNNTASK